MRRMWSLTRLCCMSFLRTRIEKRMTRMWSLTRLGSLRNFKNKNSSNDTNVEPTSSLLYELFKNTNSANDMRMWSLPRLCMKEKTTNTTDTTNTTGERLCYEYFSIKLSEVVSVVLVVFVVFKISNELLVLKSQTGYL